MKYSNRRQNQFGGRGGEQNLSEDFNTCTNATKKGLMLISVSKNAKAQGSEIMIGFIKVLS